MKFEELLQLAKETDFVDVWERENKVVITINDFEGFDEDWDEIMVPDEELEDAFALLEKMNEYGTKEEGYHTTYHFDDKYFEIQWSSEDI